MVCSSWCVVKENDWRKGCLRASVTIGDHGVLRAQIGILSFATLQQNELLVTRSDSRSSVPKVEVLFLAQADAFRE